MHLTYRNALDSIGNRRSFIIIPVHVLGITIKIACSSDLWTVKGHKCHTGISSSRALVGAKRRGYRPQTPQQPGQHAPKDLPDNEQGEEVEEFGQQRGIDERAAKRR